MRFPRATHLIVGFQHESDAQQFLSQLTERFRKFNLELHPEKTRLIEFGRFAAKKRRRRGQGKPDTFAFLGFTHICRELRSGRFSVLRQTMLSRMRAKLHELKVELRRRLHDPVPEVGRWLRSVLQGHYRYYGVPRNNHALSQFRNQVVGLWFRTLRRRSQKTLTTWARMNRLARRYLRRPRLYHPYPEQRLCVTT